MGVDGLWGLIKGSGDQVKVELLDGKVLAIGKLLVPTARDHNLQIQINYKFNFYRYFNMDASGSDGISRRRRMRFALCTLTWSL